MRDITKQRAQTIATIIALALGVTLSACGGGGSNSSDGASTSSEASKGDSNASNGSSNAGESANASFFNSIFMKDSGSGYYQFDANTGPTGGKVVATGRTSFFVNADADANVSAATAAVAGDYTQRYVDQAYITSEGAFTSRTTPYTDLGTNSKIFQKLSQGYEIGMQGMSTPLYRVTIKQQDVSGQALADVIRQDRGPSTNRLYALLNGDTSPMPQGAQIYQNPNTVVTTHIWVNLASAGSSGWKSLEQAQASSGGSIESMGGYRYLKAASNSVYVDYNGTICYGEFESAGDIHDVMPAAYNRIAADFIAQREVAALTQ